MKCFEAPRTVQLLPYKQISWLIWADTILGFSVTTNREMTDNHFGLTKTCHKNMTDWLNHPGACHPGQLRSLADLLLGLRSDGISQLFFHFALQAHNISSPSLRSTWQSYYYGRITILVNRAALTISPSLTWLFLLFDRNDVSYNDSPNIHDIPNMPWLCLKICTKWQSAQMKQPLRAVHGLHSHKWQTAP